MSQPIPIASVAMSYNKETKNAYRYSPVNDRNPVGDVYVKKTSFANGVAASRIRVAVTIEPD